MKKIMFIVMIFLMIGSWYIVLANGSKKYVNYNNFINTANSCIDKKIYIDAIEYYKKAIKIYPDILENKIRLAGIYKAADFYSSYEDYCIKLADEYKSNEKIISMLGDYYVEIGKEEKAIAIYKSFLSEYKDKKIVAERLDSLKSAFDLDYHTYSDISVFRNGYAVFKKGSKYGIMNNYGDETVKAVYEFSGVYDRSDLLKLAPVLSEGEWFYIDTEGNRRLIADVKYDYLGTFSDEGVAVFKRDNFYGYLDKKFNELCYEYDYASSFFDSGAAAVKVKDKWFLINKDMEKINDEQYDEIKIDDLGCSVRAKIIFAKKDGKYMILDIKGNKITEPLFDDVDFFISSREYAAVKIGNKWGFIDYEGNMVIEPKFDAALSFSCGLAPVLIEDKWGYIDKSENVVISPQFNKAKSFNSSGAAAVLKSEWQILQLKYYRNGGK